MTRRTASGKFRPSLLQRLSPSVDTREFLHKGNAALANLLEDWRELKVHFLSPGLSLATDLLLGLSVRISVNAGVARSALQNRGLQVRFLPGLSRQVEA